MSWRYAHAIVPGPSHFTKGRPCQDFGFVEALPNAVGKELLIAAVSDGAGGALKAEVGAELACVTLHGALRDWASASHSVCDLTQSQIHAWIERVQEAVAHHAKTSSLDMFQYSCTLLFAIAGPDGALFVQVGDGAMVTENGSAYGYVFWPESGEYNNITYFVTDKDACDHVRMEVRPGPPQALGLFSDGFERLLLQFDTRTARSDIFRVLFDRLSGEPAGYSSKVADELDSFLRSPALVARTYDDRTLILAKSGD